MSRSSKRRRDITICAPFRTQEEAYLVLYRKGEPLPEREIPFLPSDYRGIMRTAVAEDVDVFETEYNFRVGDRILQDERAVLIRGRSPFGELSPGRADPHGVRCGFALKPFDWGEDTPLRLPYEQVISYLLHVRGFTRHPRSGVRRKGTFAGLTEKIPYLQDLGINQVVLMPAYEFDEQVGCPGPEGKLQNRVNYWGYGSGWYFAPKAGYAWGKDPDVELKTMIRAFHQAGIEVVMEFAFGADCSLRRMEDCLAWWTFEYHVDGFLLMAAPECVQELAKSPLLACVKLMSHYFDPGLVFSGEKTLPGRVLANCNDGFKIDCRRLLKGDENMLSLFADRMRQNGDRIAQINYITGHDGFTLADLVTYDKKHNEDNGQQGMDGAAVEYSWNCGVEGPSRKTAVKKLRLQQMKNALTMLFMAQGTPMLLAGDEFGNSQQGNNNPWCQDNPVTWLDFKGGGAYGELTDYVKALIRLRKSHPVFAKSAPLTGMDTSSCGYPDVSCHGEHAWYGDYSYQNRHIGLMYCDASGGEEDFLYAAFNLHWERRTLALPYLPEGMHWEVALRTDEGGKERASSENEAEPPFPERMLQIPGRSVWVLAGVKDRE